MFSSNTLKRLSYNDAQKRAHLAHFVVLLTHNVHNQVEGIPPSSPALEFFDAKL